MDYPKPPLDVVKRLAIMIILERNTTLGFTELQKIMKISKGALDSHLRALENHSFIFRERKFVETVVRVHILPTHIGLTQLKTAKRKWKELLNEDDET